MVSFLVKKAEKGESGPAVSQFRNFPFVHRSVTTFSALRSVHCSDIL